MRQAAAPPVLVAAAPGLPGMGIWTLRQRPWYDGMPAAGLLIDRARGAEPPRVAVSDQRLPRSGAWWNVAFGLFFTPCRAAGIFAFPSE